MQSFAFLVPRFQLHFFKFPLVWHRVVSPHLDNFKQIRADPKVEGVSVFLFCFALFFYFTCALRFLIDMSEGCMY